MDKCIICQRVFDIVKPFLVELDDNPNCDFCERRWCIDCADDTTGTSFLYAWETDVGKVKCFLCAMSERKGNVRISYRHE